MRPVEIGGLARSPRAAPAPRGSWRRNRRPGRETAACPRARNGPAGRRASCCSATKREGASAMSIQAGSSNATPALTSAAIISPFQSASTLSSRPGRTRACRELVQQVGAQRGEPRLVLGMLRGTVLEAVEDIVAFEIASGGHVVMLRRKTRHLPSPSTCVDLAQRPDVELALLALANRRRARRRRRPPAVVISRASQPTVSRARWR